MVQTSLYTGLSGLRAHQTYIDVIGANLANVSTSGYRGSRVTFGDILSFTTQAGSGPNGSFGGTNPMQIGLGATIGSIDTNTNQGTFKDTGRPLDVALQGKGFFTLTNGAQTFYTRSGTFGIDANRNLVDVRSGLKVVNSTGGDITIPVSDTLAANQSTSVSYGGTLPATVTGPLAEIVQSSSPMLAGVAASKSGTPLTGSTYDLSGFLNQSILVQVNGQSQQKITFTATNLTSDPTGAAVTATNLKTIIENAMGSELQATVGTAGALTYDTVKLGTGATLKFDEQSTTPGLLTALGLNTVLTQGSESAGVATTDIAKLTTRQTEYVNGDTISIQGTNPDGTPFSGTVTYTDGTVAQVPTLAGATVQTLDGMVSYLNELIDSAAGTVALDASGNITFTATDKQTADMSLSIGDTAIPAKNLWPNFTLSQDGADADTASASIDIVDSLGRTHPVQFQFTRSTTDDATWSLVASMDASEGTVSSATVSNITFNADGSFNVIGGATKSFTFNFSGLAAQDVSVNLGTSGKFDGVAMLGDSTTVAATDQDGFGPGTLLNVAFDPQGNLVGFYTNGQNQALDQLRVSIFPNEAGLLRTGDTMFVESPNSDNAITSTALAAGAGSIRAGSLENSNVDIAEEFVNLIEAQRGFQANSRIITTTDEILAELVNIVR